VSHLIRILNGKQPSGGTGGVSDADLSNIALNFFSKGVAKPDDYKVEQQATPNMTVKVNTGEAYVANSATTMLYNTVLDAIANVTIAANAAGNPRIDAVVIKIDVGVTPNNFANNVASLVAVQGTAAASPSAPTDSAIQAAVGGSNPFYRLANVTVANGATSITTANIANTREGVTLRIVGGYIRYNLTTNTLQYSNNGTTFTDLSTSSIKRKAVATVSTETDVVTQIGWDFTQGDGNNPSNVAKAITFPTPFTTLFSVHLTLLGLKASAGDPTAITQFTADYGVLAKGHAESPTVNGFNARVYVNGTLPSSNYVGFTWIAYGKI
jgi:hypothetical protein